MDTTQTTTTLEQEIAALERAEVLVETNEGTYSPTDAQRATGTGVPANNDYRIHESVGGRRRHEGCEVDRAPGYARRLGSRELATKRSELARLRAALRKGS